MVLVALWSPRFALLWACPSGRLSPGAIHGRKRALPLGAVLLTLRFVFVCQPGAMFHVKHRTFRPGRRFSCPTARPTSGRFSPLPVPYTDQSVAPSRLSAPPPLRRFRPAAPTPQFGSDNVAARGRSVRPRGKNRLCVGAVYRGPTKVRSDAVRRAGAMFHVKHRRPPPGPSPSPAGVCSTVHSSPARAVARLASAGTCRGSPPLPSPAASFVSTFLSCPVRAAIRSASAGTCRGSLPLPSPEFRPVVLRLRASGRARFSSPRAGSLLNARSRARLERCNRPTGVRSKKSGRTNRQVVGLPT